MKKLQEYPSDILQPIHTDFAKQVKRLYYQQRKARIFELLLITLYNLWREFVNWFTWALTHVWHHLWVIVQIVFMLVVGSYLSGFAYHTPFLQPTNATSSLITFTLLIWILFETLLGMLMLGLGKLEDKTMKDDSETWSRRSSELIATMNGMTTITFDGHQYHLQQNEAGEILRAMRFVDLLIEIARLDDWYRHKLSNEATYRSRFDEIMDELATYLSDADMQSLNYSMKVHHVGLASPIAPNFYK